MDTQFTQPGAEQMQAGGGSTGGPIGWQFFGTGGSFLVTMLIVTLLSAITLGIYSPWGMAYVARWMCENSTLQGRRLTFTGSGGTLFGMVLVLVLLSAITLGIYSFWGYVKIYRYMFAHIEYAQ
jgi:uncharacterized membrane protein YjgN (DUF898 family)